MRPLPVRNAHGGRGAAQSQTRAYGRRHRRGHHEHLPMWNVRAHPQGYSCRCETGMNRVAHVGILAVCLAATRSVSVHGDAPDRTASLAAFERVASVLTSPRCQNCHPLAAFPTQGDDAHRHALNVMRGPDDHGAPALQCPTCHGRANNSASGVPGAEEDWRLAPLSMGWQGVSRAELCAQLKDPARNGGRTGADVIDHLKTPLVLWGWSPGSDARGVARTTPASRSRAFL